MKLKMLKKLKCEATQVYINTKIGSKGEYHANKALDIYDRLIRNLEK